MELIYNNWILNQVFVGGTLNTRLDSNNILNTNGFYITIKRRF